MAVPRMVPLTKPRPRICLMLNSNNIDVSRQGIHTRRLWGLGGQDGGTSVSSSPASTPLMELSPVMKPFVPYA